MTNRTLTGRELDPDWPKTAGSSVSHLCCHQCRMRFTAEAADFITVCPGCDGAASRVQALTQLVGYRLFDPLDLTDLVIDEPSTCPPNRRDDGRNVC